MKRFRKGVSYDHLMGTPMDANKHPINNLPTPMGMTSPMGTGILPSPEMMAPNSPLGPSGEYSG